MLCRLKSRSVVTGSGVVYDGTFVPWVGPGIQPPTHADAEQTEVTLEHMEN